MLHKTAFHLKPVHHTSKTKLTDIAASTLLLGILAVALIGSANATLVFISPETLRKYPPAPIFLRKCTKPYRVPESEVVIEQGLTVLIPAYGLHLDPEYFPDPERFDPDRFNEENKNKIWDYTYIPFGDGPRICIGMRFAMIQIKIALSLILQKFDIPLSEKTMVPLQMENKGIILTPIGGIWLDLVPIKK